MSHNAVFSGECWHLPWGFSTVATCQNHRGRDCLSDAGVRRKRGRELLARFGPAGLDRPAGCWLEELRGGRYSLPSHQVRWVHPGPSSRGSAVP